MIPNHAASEELRSWFNRFGKRFQPIGPWLATAKKETEENYGVTELSEVFPIWQNSAEAYQNIRENVMTGSAPATVRAAIRRISIDATLNLANIKISDVNGLPSNWPVQVKWICYWEEATTPLVDPDISFWRYEPAFSYDGWSRTALDTLLKTPQIFNIIAEGAAYLTPMSLRRDTIDYASPTVYGEIVVALGEGGGTVQTTSPGHLNYTGVQFTGGSHHERIRIEKLYPKPQMVGKDAQIRFAVCCNVEEDAMYWWTESFIDTLGMPSSEVELKGLIRVDALT